MSPGRWKIFAALVAVVQAGCGATPEMKASYAGRWVGQSLDSFAIRHGIPQLKQPMADGRMLVEWTDNYGIGRGGALADTLVASIGGAQTQGDSYQLTCKVRMIVGKTGIIQDFQVVGDTVGAWNVSRCAEALG